MHRMDIGGHTNCCQSS